MNLSFLKKSLPVFLAKRVAYEFSVPRSTGSPEGDDTLKSLRESGVAILRDYFSRTEVQQWKQQLTPFLDSLKSGHPEAGIKHYSNPEYGVYRLMEADRWVPNTQKFFNDPRIESIARSYVGSSAHSYQRMAELKPTPGAQSIADTVHFDDWKHRFKAFLYLTDVGPENAPFAYLPGSHRFGAWRFRKEFEYFSGGKDGSYGYFNDSEVEALRSRFRFDCVEYPAAAGTLILADTRGLHRGTSLVSGQRILLANYFT